MLYKGSCHRGKKLKRHFPRVPNDRSSLKSPKETAPVFLDAGRFSFHLGDPFGSFTAPYQRIVTVAIVGFVVCTDEL
jgi:hypothetical protein